MRVSSIALPASEPVTLAEAKEHLRMDEITDEDSLISSIITSARAYLEASLSRVLISRQAVFEVQSWCAQYKLPLAPVSAIVSVQYVDADGVTQTIDATDYYLMAGLDPRLVMIGTEPSRLANSVLTITATVGDAAFDPALKQAMLLMIGHFYENRQQDVTGTITSALKLGALQLAAPFNLATIP